MNTGTEDCDQNGGDDYCSGGSEYKCTQGDYGYACYESSQCGPPPAAGKLLRRRGIGVSRARDLFGR
jgi:hypothetical protein